MPRPVISKGYLFPRFYEEFAHLLITFKEEVCMAFRALTPLTLAAVTLLSGCSMFRSYDTELQATNQQLATGNVDGALTLLEKNNAGEDKDLLYFFEKGELSVVFAGHGVKALQEAGVFGTRPVAFFDFDWLGIHADAYSLSAQALAVLAIVVLYGRSRLAEKRRVVA
jgi:hypothetical protein